MGWRQVDMQSGAINEKQAGETDQNRQTALRQTGHSSRDWASLDTGNVVKVCELMVW